MKKTLLLLLTLFSLGFLVVIVLLGNSFVNIDKIEDSLPQLNIGESKFPVKSIFSVTLEVNESKQLITRSRKNFLWESSFNADVINERLEYISKLKGEMIEPFKNISGAISFKFSNGKTWKAVFNQFYFRWTLGPFKGEGGRFSAGDSYLFSSGRNMFNKDDISWCDTKITKISGKAARKGEVIKRWADKNCTIQVETLIDQHIYNPEKFNYLANVFYSNSTVGTIEWDDTGLFRITSGSSKKTFVSKAFLKEVNQLSLRPLEGK
jgi:hypothetical protein